MKRKQLVKQEDDSSSDYTYSEDELPRSRSKKMRSASTVKRERDEPNPTADSDSEDFQGCGKEQSLRAMKQTVVDWIRQAYMVGEQGWTAKADIFDDYLSEWARLGKEAQLTAPAFGRLVHRAFPGIKSCRMGPRIRARHCYKGLIRRDSLVAPSSSSSAASSPFLHSAPYSSSATSPVPTSSSVSSPASSSPIQLPNHHLPEFELQGHIDQQVLIDLDLESELATHGFAVKEEPHTEEDEDDLLLLQQYQYQYQQQQQQQLQQEAYYQPSSYPVVKQEMHFYPQPAFHHHQQQQQQLQEAYAPQPHAGVYMSPTGSFHHHHQHQVPAYYSPSDVSDPGCTSSTSSSPAMSSAPHDIYSSTTLSSSSSFPAYTSASTAVPPYYAHHGGLPYATTTTSGWTYPTPAGEAVLPATATYAIPPLLAVSAFGAPSASTNTPGSQLSLSSSFSRAEFLSSFFDA